MPLRPPIVVDIGFNRVGNTILIVHGHSKGCALSLGNARRRVRLQPLRMGLTGVRAARPAILVFLRNRQCQIDSPHVVSQGCAHPDRAGVMEMNGTIAGFCRAFTLGSCGHVGRNGKELVCPGDFYCRALLEKIGIDGSPVCRVEHLAGLEDHLDDVLVPVSLRGLLGIGAENK